MLILTKPLSRLQLSVMRVLHISLLLCLSLVASRVCNGKNVDVVGFGECIDCTQPSTNTVSGLLIRIECKDGTRVVRSEGKLDEQGKFRVSLPEEVVEEGKLKEDCDAQLQSTSGTTTLCPVPSHEADSSSKMVLIKSSIEGTHEFETKGKLKFSRAACASSHQSLFKNPDYYLKHHPIFKKKKHLPHIPIYKKPFPPIPAYKKPLPPPIPVYEEKPFSKPIYKKHLPHIPIYKKPFPPIPAYKKPLPPPIPVYEEKPFSKPIYKKHLPHIPIYKKPFPPIPVYKKPLPPPIPVYEEKPFSKPIYKKHLPHIPIYKKPFPPIPVYKKPLPPPIPVYEEKPFSKPIYKKPISIPIYKKPCPPLPHLKKPFVPIYKKPLPLPPFPFPPKPFP